MCSWFFVSLASALALQVLVLYKQERNKDSSVVYLMIVEEVCFSSEKYFLCCVLCFAFFMISVPTKNEFYFSSHRSSSTVILRCGANYCSSARELRGFLCTAF